MRQPLCAILAKVTIISDNHNLVNKCLDLIVLGPLTGYVDILGHRVDVSEIRVKLIVENTGSNYEANSDWQALVLLDCTVDESAESEGLAREVTNRMQKLRKEVPALLIVCCISVLALSLSRFDTPYLVSSLQCI